MMNAKNEYLNDMMMNTRIWYILFLACMAWSCGKEDGNLTSSNEDVDWFRITEKPGVVNGMIYDVYKTYGVPVFYNDTLGYEDRGEDAYGQPVTHYELIKVGFGISYQYTNIRYVLSADTAAMIKAVELLESNVLKVYPRKLKKPHSYLLVDSLFLAARGYQSIEAYWSLTTTVIGQLADILNMTDAQQKVWCGMILAEDLVSHVMDGFYDEKLNDFYAVTDDGSVAGISTCYEASATYNITSGWTHKFFNVDTREWGFVGGWEFENIATIISAGEPFDVITRKTASKVFDVKCYIAAVYAYTGSEFEQLYQDWPKCIKKYRLMKSIMDDFKERYN